MNSLNPKQHFQKSSNFREHEALVLKESFQEAISTALNEMTLRQPSTGNPSSAWDCHCRIVGAREFIHILLNLAEKEPPKIRDTTGTLHYPSTAE